MKKIFCIFLAFLALFNVFTLSVNAEENTKPTNVIFTGEVPKNITGDLYLTAINLSTKEVYTFYLQDISNYTTYEYLPVGTYNIVEGGKTNDLLNEFEIEYKTFEVSEFNTIVNIKFGPDANKHSQESITQNTISENSAQESVKKIQEEKSIWQYLRWVVLIIVCGLIIFSVFMGIKFFKNEI